MGMRRIVKGAVLLSMVTLLAAGCATRDWVRELMGKKEVEFDQKLGEQNQRVEGMGFQLKTVETGLGETTQVARGARERADAASSRAEDVDQRLSRLWSNRQKRDLVETLEVKFGFDKWDLTDAAQTSLASLVKELRENQKLTVDLAGYADPKGTFDYNVALSQRRVEAVRRHLVEKGVELPRINLVGLGPILDGGLSDAQKRRVTVRLMVASD
jgi:outer membrane protein OmpA-like peptidoglycan-associated protein